MSAPSVLSSSFGTEQEDYSDKQVTALEDVLATSVSLGVTICKASGDQGAYLKQSEIKYPATSSSVLSCGGTYLSQPDGQRVETVWGGSGGGVSETFPLPDWQSAAGVPLALNDSFSGRGVPDVAANASPDSAYLVCLNGEGFRGGGTSAAAPLWAGLVALLNEELPRSVGFLNPDLYDFMNGSGFNQVTSGNNGYPAQTGWDRCTGLGTPSGTNLLAYLRSRQT